eukprot:15449097-Alexandrium_andersonii.AAC.1
MDFAAAEPAQWRFALAQASDWVSDNRRRSPPRPAPDVPPPAELPPAPAGGGGAPAPDEIPPERGVRLHGLR